MYGATVGSMHSRRVSWTITWKENKKGAVIPSTLTLIPTEYVPKGVVLAGLNVYFLVVASQVMTGVMMLDVVESA